MPTLDRLLNPQRWQYAIRKRLLGLALSRVPVDGSVATERIGSEFGGWTVPLQLVKPYWVVYGVGAGGDVSFDIELIRRTVAPSMYSIRRRPRPTMCSALTSMASSSPR